MSEEVGSRLDRVVSDLEIRRLMHEYAASIDARDWDRLRSILADDVVVAYHNGRNDVVGADQVVTYVETNTAHFAWQHHYISPYAIDVDGDRASGRVYLISHQVIAEDPGTVVSMAAYYDNEYRRSDGEWRLTRMTHSIVMNNFLPLTSVPPAGVSIPPAVQP